MYIVIEGVDGSGKTTQIKQVTENLEKLGYKTKTLIEPTTSQTGKLIRKQLKNPNSTRQTQQQMLALLFAADRLTIKEEIENNKNTIILSDRSYYSSIAYQNNKTIKPGWIKTINKHAPKPDLTILLDVNPEESIKRCEKQEAFEEINFLKKTRNNYLKLEKTEENMIKIDANKTQKEVEDKIMEIIISKL